MNRSEITRQLIQIFSERFEIEDPGLDDNLREDHEFDSIDAIELLHEIELMLGWSLTQDQKKQAMGIATLNQIVDYIIDLQTDAAAS